MSEVPGNLVVRSWVRSGLASRLDKKFNARPPGLMTESADLRSMLVLALQVTQQLHYHLYEIDLSV